MLACLRSLMPVPLLQGLPFGHTLDKLTLPVGAACHVRSDPTGLQLVLSDYPTLRTQT